MNEYPDPFSEITFDEWISETNLTGLSPRPNALRITLSPGLQYRKVYCYSEALRGNNTATYFAMAEVSLNSKNQPPVRLPANIGTDGGNLLIPGSLPSLWCPGQTFVNDSLCVILSKKFAVDTAIINPVKVMSNAVDITYSLGTTGGVNGVVQQVRVFLLVTSSNNPF